MKKIIGAEIKKMKKYLYISFAIAAFLFAAPESSYACSCFVPLADSVEKQVENALDEAAAVFSGKVVEVTPTTDDSYSVNVKFKVTSKWKGVSDKIVVVNTGQNTAMCGFNFEVGKTYVVYAHRIDSGLSTTICSRTAEYRKDGDAKYLKKQKKKKRA